MNIGNCTEGKVRENCYAMTSESKYEQNNLQKYFASYRKNTFSHRLLSAKGFNCALFPKNEEAHHNNKNFKICKEKPFHNSLLPYSRTV